MDECIFCKMAKGEIKVDKIYEDDNFFAFPDAHPAVSGHTLILPKKHFVNMMDIPVSLGKELIEAIKKVAEIRMRGGYEGFNLVQNNFPSAGQAVMHFHIHLLPRKKGDGFKLNL